MFKLHKNVKILTDLEIVTPDPRNSHGVVNNFVK